MQEPQSPAIFLTACKDYLENVVSEYFTLSLLDELTEQQEMQLLSILKKAETDSLLSFLLDETDHVVGHLLNLVDVNQTRLEQDKLRHKMDQDWIAWSLSHTKTHNNSVVPEGTVEQAQERLKEKGLYTAEVDGVCGVKMKEAFQQLEKKFHQYLKQNGLYPEIEREDQQVDTDEAIRFVKEKEGIDDHINDDADLLSFGTWLSFC